MGYFIAYGASILIAVIVGSGLTLAGVEEGSKQKKDTEKEE